MIERAWVLGGCLATIAWSTVACGETQYMAAWERRYPASTLPERLFDQTGSDCNVCHHPSNLSAAGNCYRDDLSALLGTGLSIEEAVDAADGWDSDGDGFTNGEEALVPRADHAWHVGYSMGLIGDLGTDPCANDPGEPVTGVPETPPVAAETICPDDPGDYHKQFGGPVVGDALDLCDSDDVRLQVRQFAQVSPLLPFVRLEYWAHSTFAEGPIASLDYAIEAHVSALVGGGQNPDTLRTHVKNYATGAFELIDQRGTLPSADETITHAQTMNAPDYVQSGDGEVRVRQDVWSPGAVFAPNWFLKVDLYEVTVTQGADAPRSPPPRPASGRSDGGRGGEPWVLSFMRGGWLRTFSR